MTQHILSFVFGCIVGILSLIALLEYPASGSPPKWFQRLFWWLVGAVCGIAFVTGGVVSTLVWNCHILPNLPPELMYSTWEPGDTPNPSIGISMGYDFMIVCIWSMVGWATIACFAKAHRIKNPK